MLNKFGLDPRRAPRAVLSSEEPIIRFFSYHDAHPIALGMVVMEAFGPEALDWDAGVLRREIVRHFKATSISDQNWEKLQAFRALLLTTGTWTEWEIFEKVVQALNNNWPDPNQVQQCTVAQLMAGVDTINEVREEPWGEEVRGYVAACAIEEGVTFLPPPLQFAQPWVSEPSFECGVCGHIQEAPAASHLKCMVSYDTEHPLDDRGAPKECPLISGNHFRRFLKRDPSGVEDQFNKWKALEQADVNEEDPIQVQAAKLVVGHRYMLLRRKQLVDQLEELQKWVSKS